VAAACLAVGGVCDTTAAVVASVKQVRKATIAKAHVLEDAPAT
jgi:hypothetical protein